MDPILIFPATIYPLGGKLSFPVASLLALVPVLSAMPLPPAQAQLPSVVLLVPAGTSVAIH